MLESGLRFVGKLRRRRHAHAVASGLLGLIQRGVGPRDKSGNAFVLCVGLVF
jgi:hypothetical protein